MARQQAVTGPRVLVVDDDPRVRSALRIALTAHGYRVSTAADGAQALRTAAAEHPELVLLDLGLPDLDGTDVIAGLRGWTAAPIVVLSGRTTSASKVDALDAGADDYLTKPFGMDELLARMRATLRRAAADVGQEIVVDAGEFTVDLAAKRVVRRGAPVHLTPTEWRILELLVRNQGKIVGHRRLLDEARGADHRSEGAYLRIYLSQLRRKLEREPTRPRNLITETGMGYRFEP